MEEFVGKYWHRLVTRGARRDHPDARVCLAEMDKTVGILFRAMGGDGGMRVEPAAATEHDARRSWLQRLAGTGRKLELGWRDEQALRFPSEISVYPQRELNRKLYLWLAALAAEEGDTENNFTSEGWLLRSQRLSQQVLQRYPGLGPHYRALVTTDRENRVVRRSMSPPIRA